MSARPTTTLTRLLKYILHRTLAHPRPHARPCDGVAPLSPCAGARKPPDCGHPHYPAKVSFWAPAISTGLPPVHGCSCRRPAHLGSVLLERIWSKRNKQTFPQLFVALRPTWSSAGRSDAGLWLEARAPPLLPAPLCLRLALPAGSDARAAVHEPRPAGCRFAAGASSPVSGGLSLVRIGRRRDLCVITRQEITASNTRLRHTTRLPWFSTAAPAATASCSPSHPQPAPAPPHNSQRPPQNTCKLQQTQQYLIHQQEKSVAGSTQPFVATLVIAIRHTTAPPEGETARGGSSAPVRGLMWRSFLLQQKPPEPAPMRKPRMGAGQPTGAARLVLYTRCAGKGRSWEGGKAGRGRAEV